MASTTQTSNYGLPIYVAGDRASWTDTNEPFEEIDEAVHTAVETAEGASDNVNLAVTAATEAKGLALTASAGVREMQSTKQDKTDNSLETTSKTVVGAINEINDYLTALTWGTPIAISKTKYVATRDGYVVINSSTLTEGKMGIKLYDDGNNSKTVLEVDITSRYQYANVFVRKGLGIALTDDTSEGVVANFDTLL